MHTLKKNQNHNTRLIEFCLNYAYPDGNITLQRLIDDNLINGTQVAELAVCRTNGSIDIHPIGIGMDLTDDSDVKTGTVQVEQYKSTKGTTLVRHRVQIKDIVNKIGLLRVIVFNPLTNTWSFFKIPNVEFAAIKRLTISYCQRTGNPIGKYKQFQVPGWVDLCN